MVRLLAVKLMVMWFGLPEALEAQPASTGSGAELRVFLDCRDDCFQDFMREEIEFVEYVRDSREADVHVIVTTSTTGAGGRERAVSFVGNGRFAGIEHQLRATTEAGDPEDQERRMLANAIIIGLLNYQAAGGIGRDLSVDVRVGDGRAAQPPLDDPWNNWVMSLRGSTSLQGEETSREAQWTAEIGADRITDLWKITIGAEFDYSREDFDLDEEEPLRAYRDERELNTLVVRAIDDHWSWGGLGQFESSTFNNLDGQVYLAPAVEFNLFPYSAYTRRQLRVNYSVGPYRAWYNELTLFNKLEETLGRHEASVTLDQREPWGSLEIRFEASSFLPGLDRHRLDLEGDVSLRLARGLSLTVEGTASRLRDQLSLPKRDATDEEVLLRLRQLQSGYEYELQVGLTYTFGSIFNTIVNPRFGQ
jgi:hypothetical protein